MMLVYILFMQWFLLKDSQYYYIYSNHYPLMSWRKNPKHASLIINPQPPNPNPQPHVYLYVCM